MDAIDSPQTGQPSLTQDILSLLRYWLTSRTGLIIGAIVLVVGGLALGWGWVVALGIAPIILSLAPCAVMCALGMCMMGKGMSGQSSCAKDGSATDADKTAAKSGAAPLVKAERRSTGGA